MNSTINLYLLKCVGIILIIGITIFATGGPVYCGELLPLPSEGLQQKRVDPRVYTEFRQRIQPLNCSSLKQLREKLINTCGSQVDQNKVDYYMNLQRIVDDTLRSNNCR
jgi:hypothetical protein